MDERTVKRPIERNERMNKHHRKMKQNKTNKYQQLEVELIFYRRNAREIQLCHKLCNLAIG